MGGEDSRWWSQDTVAVVTGGNKGIGLAFVKQLAERGITVVLTSRDVTRGEEATKKLVEQGFPVVFHQLDVTKDQSAQKLAEWLKQQYGGIDILVNNAGILDTASNLDAAVATMDTNLYGVKRVTKAIFPILKASDAGARILNVSSGAGQLQLLINDSAKKILANVDELSEAAIDKLIDEFYADVRQQQQNQWVDALFNPSYVVSKACLNAYTRLVAKQVADRPVGQKIYVNCFSPGYTSTDMADTFLNTLEGPLPEGVTFHTPEVAASHAVWLILLPAKECPTGIFSTAREECDY
eukprot:TRINITY_DN489_c0_g1_i1.p1 TRINITY_DN489_c0_g1~~TRINITY_DN489_c0_g1_i1.p1  ORF type:complete len:296 (-),score=55.15 TRINITY_DN489_c0_g1_i1:336-1223(-)